MKRLKGETPAVILINPKYPHNVGSVLRACACWGIPQLWWTGDRVSLELDAGERLPREERLKGYQMVDYHNDDKPLKYFTDIVPVAIEVRENAESLTDFVHPENAVYLFGPEDGGITKPWLTLCHRFIMIPTHFCLNLAAAVNIVLYDRRVKRQQLGLEPKYSMDEILLESRGWVGKEEI
jgi:tRNA C32,U32 (ribose-2'-O)-methylase TrmJ